MATIDLGLVTAYAYAVSKGYSGTEAQFAQELANLVGMTAQANTLPAGSSATAAYNNGVLSLGIPKGDKGDTGNTGPVGPTGPTGPTGATGNGIVSVTKTGTVGLVDTYTITFTDGTTTTFEVTNGDDGTVTPEQMTAAIAAALVDYAKTDGYYIDMSVGNAEQLISDIYETDSVPYTFRTSGGSLDIGDREVDEIVGGTVVWNQGIPIPTNSITATVNGITLTDNRDGTYTLNGTATDTAFFTILSMRTMATHKFVLTGCRCPSGGSPTTYCLSLWGQGADKNDTGTGAIWDATGNAYKGVRIRIESGTTVNNLKFKPALTDLTLALGTAIADYVYSLETATAGAGVAWLKSHFPRMFGQYQPYEPGALESVSGVSAHEMTGFNQWDEDWENGYYDRNTGSKAGNSNTSYIRSKNFIPCLPNTAYYYLAPRVHASNNTYYASLYYDESKNFISAETVSYISSHIVTTPNNARFMTFYVEIGTSGATYQNDICINLSWDGSRNGEYEPYVKHSYALDDSLTLRGIPKLDANNSLYYDGDTYASDGTVTRRYGVRAYQNGDTSDGSTMVTDGTNTVYKLATPTTEAATPYTNPQVVDDFGTEEYVTNSIVPVGHVTQYQPDLKAKLEMAPDSPDTDGDYIVRHSGGQNAYVALSSNATIQDMLNRITALENA